MRFSSFSLFLVTLASCTPEQAEQPQLARIPATLPVRAEQYPGNTIPISSEGSAEPDFSRHSLIAQTANVAGVTLSYLSFDTRTHTIEVIDQPGLGSKYHTAAQVTKSTGAVAAINGGFFTPEGKPLGVLYHQGGETGALNTASSLGSGFLYVDKSSPSPLLTRRTTFQKLLKDSAFTPREALQSGPFLVENGAAVSGLSNKEPRVRSLLLWDGENHFAIAQCEPISLRNLAGALAQQPLPNFQVQMALNLDGGRSADLNVSSKVQGGPLNLRRWLNKPVRNYLIVKSQ